MGLHGLPYIVFDENTPSGEITDQLEMALINHPEDELKILRFLVPYAYRSKPHRKKCLVHADRLLKVAKGQEDKEHALYFRALVLFEERIDLDEAESIFIKLIENDPQHDNAYNQLIQLYLDKNEQDKALNYAVQMSEQEGLKEIGLGQMGDVLLFMERPTQALEAYLEVLRYQEDSYFSLHGAAKSYLALEDYSNALEHFERAHQECHYEEPLNPYGVGLCYQHLDDPYRAMKWYTIALSLDPMMPEALNNMATLEHQLNNGWEQAVPYLLKAVELSNEAISKEMQPIYRNLWAYYTNILDHDKAEYYQRLNYKCLGLDDDTIDFLGQFD